MTRLLVLPLVTPSCHFTFLAYDFFHFVSCPLDNTSNTSSLDVVKRISCSFCAIFMNPNVSVERACLLGVTVAG